MFPIQSDKVIDSCGCLPRFFVIEARICFLTLSKEELLYFFGAFGGFLGGIIIFFLFDVDFFFDYFSIDFIFLIWRSYFDMNIHEDAFNRSCSLLDFINQS